MSLSARAETYTPRSASLRRSVIMRSCTSEEISPAGANSFFSVSMRTAPAGLRGATAQGFQGSSSPGRSNRTKNARSSRLPFSA